MTFPYPELDDIVLKDYHSWLIEKLTDPNRAATYLAAALEDSEEAYRTALGNVAEAQGQTAQ